MRRYILESLHKKEINETMNKKVKMRTSNLVNVGRTGFKESAAFPLKILKEANTL